MRDVNKRPRFHRRTDSPTARAEQVAYRGHYLEESEVQFLRSLVEKLPPKPTVVNIGAGAGTSAITIMETRSDVILWTIDVEDKPNPHGGLAAEWAAMQRFHYAPSPRYHQVCGRSQDVCWEGGPIDMVFVDGGHLPEEIRGDVLAWKPRVRPGGIMVFHDYDKGREATWPGVADVADELMSDCVLLGLVFTTIALRLP